MIKENKVQMLEGVKYPLCSYQVSGFFGMKSSGKTSLINKITDEFIKQASNTKYDLENPLINNGPITHYIYLSPSIISDNTLKKQNPNNRIDIELTDENIDKTCAYIYKMRDDIIPRIDLQDQLRQFLKQKETKELIDFLLKDRLQLYRYKEIQTLTTTLKEIEQMKLKYPQLQTEELNDSVKYNLKNLYKLFGSQFDGKLLKIPKIILNFDDSTTSTKFVNFQNSPILKLITQARHLYIWSMNIVMHSLSATYGIFKDQFNVIVLHKGINRIEQLKNIFEIMDLDTSNFKEEEFIKLYQNTVGKNEDEYDQREKYRYNFLWIMKDPKTQIWQNLDKRIK